MKFKQSLSFKVVGFLVIMLIIEIPVFLILFWRVQYATFNRLYEEKGFSIAISLDSSIDINDLKDTEKLQNTINKYLLLKPEISQLDISLADKNGNLTIVASSDSTQISLNPEEGNNQVFQSGETTSLNDTFSGNIHRLHVISPILISGQIVGTYNLHLSMEKSIAEFNHQMEISLIGLIVLLIIFLVGFWLVFRKVLISPIEDLAKDVEAISAGDLTKRVVIKSRDEVGRLATAFNLASETIYKSYQGLEQKVKERTEELNKSFQTVEVQNVNLEENRKAILNILEDVKVSENKFIGLIQSSEDCIKVLNVNGKLLFLSKGGMREHGFTSQEEIKNWDYMATIKDEYAPKIKEALKQAAQGITTSLDVEHYVNKDIAGCSNREWCNMTFSLLSGQGAELNILAVSRDISKSKKLEEMLVEEKKRVELKVVERTRQLADEKNKLSSSIDNLPVGFIMTNLEAEIVVANTLASGILGTKDSGEMFTKLSSLIKDINLKELVKNCNEKKEKLIIDNIDYENKIYKIFISPILVGNVEERCIGIVVLLMDITEAKILERSKDEFFSIASHELRTPLTAIRGNSSLIKDVYMEKMKDPELAAMIDDIHDSAIRLIDIVNDFLNVSRLEMGKMEFKKESFDLVPLVAQVISELTTQAAQKKLLLKLGTQGIKTLSIFSDKDRVKEVLVNLVGNSIKYTEKGEINIDLVPINGYTKISVKDTGNGIPIEDQKLLFRKFQQAGPSLLTRDTTKSTGLGLYINKMIVEEMGGKIWLESSTVGKGSVFSFTLPVEPSKKLSIE